MAKTFEAPDIVHQGATLRELSTMFAMDIRDVRARLRMVNPRGRRNGEEYWSVAVAATHLVKFNDDNAELVDRILSMNPNSMPKILTKEYYMGKVSQLNYLERMGRVWDTPAVIETSTLMTRMVATQLKLMADQVERETGLTEPQRETIQRIVDATLEQLRSNLGNQLRARRQNTRGKAFAHGTEDDDGGLPDA